jgi:hypothetical protein
MTPRSDCLDRRMDRQRRRVYLRWEEVRSASRELWEQIKILFGW